MDRGWRLRAKSSPIALDGLFWEYDTGKVFLRFDRKTRSTISRHGSKNSLLKTHHLGSAVARRHVDGDSVEFESPAYVLLVGCGKNGLTV